MNDNKRKSGVTPGKMLFKSAFIFNPVLTQAIGICAIAAISVSFVISLTMSLILSVLLIINECLASLILKKLARWLRVICYMVISSVLLLIPTLLLDLKFSELYASVGIYLSLLAVNSIIVTRCEKYAVNNSLKLSFFDALSASVGFAGVNITVGTLREILAYGTILGKHISPLPKLSAMALPFGGLLILGFASAFQKWLIQKKFKGQPTNTFNLRTAFENPVLRDRGLNSTDGTLSILSDTDTDTDNDEDEEAYSSDYDGGKFGGKLTDIVDEDSGDTDFEKLIYQAQTVEDNTVVPVAVDEETEEES